MTNACLRCGNERAVDPDSGWCNRCLWGDPPPRRCPHPDCPPGLCEDDDQPYTTEVPD